MLSTLTSTSKVTTQSLLQKKPAGQKIIAVTAYDFTMAKLMDELVDIILVGDSLGMVIQGNTNTLSVSLEEVIYHTKCVAKALQHAHLVADMPFMTYQVSPEEAMRNAGRLLAEGQAQAVKLEGGVTMAATVTKLVESGIPVMGHIGLTPQSVHAFGGYKVQGRTESQKEAILTDAMALEDAGAYAIVLEGMPSDLAQRITERISIPTIGIGAGPYCNGQILVSQDLLGLNPNFTPRFVKPFASLSSVIKDAVSHYAKEVQTGEFPSTQHSFSAPVPPSDS